MCKHKIFASKRQVQYIFIIAKPNAVLDLIGQVPVVLYILQNWMFLEFDDQIDEPFYHFGMENDIT